MKFSKVVLAIVLSTSLSAVARAQADVSAQKVESSKSQLPNLYGKVEVRHTTTRTMNKAEIDNTIPSMSVAPTLGANLWGDKVDTAFTARYTKSAGDPALKTTEFYNETSWTWFKNDFGSIGPYAYTGLDTSTGTFSYSDMGVNLTFDHKFPTVLGDLQLKAYIEPKGELISTASQGDNANKILPRNNTGKDKFGLDNEDKAKVTQNETAGVNDSGLAIKLSPAVARKLTIGVAVDVTQKWSPKYVSNSVDADGNPVTQLDNYQYRAVTMSRLLGSYKISDSVSLIAELRHFTGGVYGYSIDEKDAKTDNELVTNRWESRVGLTADLF